MKRIFTDCQGQQWRIAINILLARTINDELGLDIHRLFDQEVLNELAGDSMKLVDLLWICVRQQAEARSISFEDMFAGDVENEIEPRVNSDVLESSIDLIFEAVVDYLPEKKRDAARKLVATLREAGNQVIDRATTELSKLDPERDGTRIANLVNGSITKMSFDTSTNSPESSGSTQTD